MIEIRVTGKKQIGIYECREKLKVRPGFVKVRVKACGICGSDLSIWKGSREKEQYFGHEFVGTVTEVGENTDGIKEGDRVASGIFKTCGRCLNCKNGQPNYCKSMSEVLYPGGFFEETIAEYSGEYHFIETVPAEMEDEIALLCEPASCALRIASQAELIPGQKVVILGMGAMGVLTGMFLKAFGASVVMGIDRNKERLVQLKDIEFDYLLDLSLIHI